jgi:hypothetical protein
MARISLAEALPIELSASIAPECIAARARIESARIRAQEDFLEEIRQARRQNPQFYVERQAFCTFVLTVWFAVNHELCSLGRRRKWRHRLPADDIRELSERFLENFTIFVAHPDGRDRYGRPLEGVIESRLYHSPDLSPGFRKLIEQHKLRDAARTELKAVADHQGGKPGKKTRKKPQATVIVDSAGLMRELKILNANRKTPQEPLELNDLSKLAAQLAAESPAGGPNKKTWAKLLAREPVRSDVLQHLERYFEEHNHRLKDGIQYLENLSSGPKT